MGERIPIDWGSCCPGCETNITPLLLHTFECGKEVWVLPPSQPRVSFHLMLNNLVVSSFHPVFQTVAGLSLFVLLANLYLAPVLTLLLVVRGQPLANVERILVGVVGCWLVWYLPTMYADFLELSRMAADHAIAHFRIVMAAQGFRVPPDWGVRDLGQEVLRGLVAVYEWINAGLSASVDEWARQRANRSLG